MAADKTPRRLTSFKKPAPPAPPAAPPRSGYDPALGYDPAVIAQIPVVGATGGGFLPAGTVLTDFEAEGLKTLGHDPSKPIPKDLAGKIAEVQARLQGPVPLPVPLDTPVTRMPTPVDISTLPPAKQAEIRRTLADLQDQLADKMTMDPNPRRGPSVPTLTPPAGPAVVDDLAPGMTGRYEPPPTPRPGEAAASIQQEAHDRAAAAYQQGLAAGRAGPDPLTNDAAGGAPPDNSAGGLLHPAECPHCGYDLKKPDPTTPTDDDKLNFVQAVLGQQRFKKTYALLGGKLRLTFRSLLTSESNMAFRQVVVDAQKDLRDRLIQDTPFYWRNLTTYRTVMALETVDSAATGTIEVPPIEEIEVDAGSYAFPDTKLLAVHDDIVQQTMPTETLQQIVGHCYNEFQALCDKLMVMAEDPNFYGAIG